MKIFTPLKLLAKISKILSEKQLQFAVAGGLAASFYRERPRLTNDVDIALVAGSNEETKSAALKLLKGCGLKTSLGWIAESQQSIASPIALVIGRVEEEDYEATVDILLPVLPWLRPAVERAQDNRIDFGFAFLPTILPEDLIIAKAFALSIQPNRFQDLDDIQSIFMNDNDLDLSLLVSEFQRLELTLPSQLHHVIPPALMRVMKEVRKKR